VIAKDISSDRDYDTLKNVVGVFVTTPQQVIDTLKDGLYGGQKTLKIDGKTVSCINVGTLQTVEFTW
jgi:hypothetical protein